MGSLTHTPWYFTNPKSLVLGPDLLIQCCINCLCAKLILLTRNAPRLVSSGTLTYCVTCLLVQSCLPLTAFPTLLEARSFKQQASNFCTSVLQHECLGYNPVGHWEQPIMLILFISNTKYDGTLQKCSPLELVNDIDFSNTILRFFYTYAHTIHSKTYMEYKELQILSSKVFVDFIRVAKIMWAKGQITCYLVHKYLSE